jgi:hypothetical protein
MQFFIPGVGWFNSSSSGHQFMIPGFGWVSEVASGGGGGGGGFGLYPYIILF